MRHRGPRLPLQLFAHRPRPPRRRPMVASRLSFVVLALGRLPRLLRSLSALRRLERDARAPCLRQADRDRLLRGPRAVLALANVMDLLADELAGLSGRRLALAPGLARALERFLLRHG